MRNTNRRGFFWTILSGIGGMIIGFIVSRLMPWRIHERVFSPDASDYTRIVYRDLGATGFKVSEIGFGAIIENINLAVLKRIHRSRIYVYVRIAFDYINVESPFFQ